MCRIMKYTEHFRDTAAFINLNIWQIIFTKLIVNKCYKNTIYYLISTGSLLTSVNLWVITFLSSFFIVHTIPDFDKSVIHSYISKMKLLMAVCLALPVKKYACTNTAILKFKNNTTGNANKLQCDWLISYHMFTFRKLAMWECKMVPDWLDWNTWEAREVMISRLILLMSVPNL